MRCIANWPDLARRVRDLPVAATRSAASETHRCAPGEAFTRIDILGDATGLPLPVDGPALRSAGADFLTRAFQAFGSLAPDNRVVRITGCDPFAGGNSGQKVLLSVDYARDDPGLGKALFVKFSRDLTDAFRDRRREELKAEVAIAALSRRPAFPVSTPRAYFADFHQGSGVGLLITERIAFGRPPIEPMRRKAMDHELDAPIEYYRPVVLALARLAAAHKSGRLSPELEALFPFDAEQARCEMPIPWSEATLAGSVSRYAAFAAACPRLLPARARDPRFIARLPREAVRFLRHEHTIKRFLNADPDYIALSHWNTHLDNAWFWRDLNGRLQCGLLDWGMARQMNVATAMWGGLSAADPGFWDAHLEELLVLFTDTLVEHGGPRLDLAELRLHLDLTIAMLGLALVLDAPALLLARMPGLPEARGLEDPMLFRDEVVRGFLHALGLFMDRWAAHDFGQSLDRLLARSARGP